MGEQLTIKDRATLYSGNHPLKWMSRASSWDPMGYDSQFWWTQLPQEEHALEMKKWLTAARNDVTKTALVMAKPNKAKTNKIESPDQKELEEAHDAWFSSARKLKQVINTVRKNISEMQKLLLDITEGFPDDDIRQHFVDRLHEGKSVASDCAELCDAENVESCVWTSVSEVRSSKAALDNSWKNLEGIHRWLNKDVFPHIVRLHPSSASNSDPM